MMRIPVWHAAVDWWRYRKSEKRHRALLHLDEVDPISCDDDYFGRLKFDRTLNWFETRRDWNGKSVRLSIAVDSPDFGHARQICRYAQPIWEAMHDWDIRLGNFAADELLDLANEWQHEAGPVSRGDFLRRITITDLSFYDDGEFEAWFEDGGLFWGHSIMIQANMTSGPMEAGIHG